ncbi:MAG: hypothetical protein ACE5R5_04510 [Nitrosarchaeum sp.]
MFGRKFNASSKSKTDAKLPSFSNIASILKNTSDSNESIKNIPLSDHKNSADVNSEPDLPKPSTSKSVNLIQEVQKLDDKTIKPFINYSEGSIFYPILSKIGESPDNVLYLDDLVSDSILAKHIYEKLIVCPLHPSVFSSSMRLYCPKCQSMNVEKLNLFEHKKCGYIAESKNFDFSNMDDSTCPSCMKEIKNFEKEIRVPAMWYQCDDCTEKFDNAVIKLHCRNYDHDFDTNSGKFITTFCYKLKNSDMSNISDTTQIKDELLKLLHGFNFTAELNSFVKGKSGNMHEIPIFGKNKSTGDSILIFIKNQSTGVDESDMNSILIPKLDIDPKHTLLVTVSGIKDGVENLAKHYDIHLISDPDFSKIISRVEEFVSICHTGKGGRK